MNGDENQSKNPVGITIAPSVKKEVEVPGGANVQGEIIHDPEVRDAGVKENPSPELSPHVEIVGPKSPFLPPAVQTPISAPQSVVSEVQQVAGIPTLDDATKIIKESGQIIPFKKQSSRVYRASVVVREKAA